MRNSVSAGLVVFVVVCFVFIAFIPAYANYIVKDLGVKVIPRDINKYGDVVGHSQQEFYYDDCTAIYWPIDGKRVDLQRFLPGNLSWAYAINDSRLMVGMCDPGPGLYCAGFVTQAQKYVRVLDSWTSISDVNNAGTIVGTARIGDEFDSQYGAVLSNGKLTILSPLPGCFFSNAVAVNKYGWVIGTSDWYDLSYATLWRNGQPTSLHPQGASCSYARAINDSCEIVGLLEYAEYEYKACYWNSPTPVTLPDFGIYGSGALDINNSGQIVGWSGLSWTEQCGVTWKRGAIRSLDRLLPSGWKAETAWAINDSGLVAFSGSYHGVPHGGLAKPKR